MSVQQTLSARYVDRQKLAQFWRTHADFRGKPCHLKVMPGSYVVQIPRKMTDAEIKSVYYDQNILDQMEAAANS